MNRRVVVVVDNANEVGLGGKRPRVTDDNLIERRVKRRRASCQFNLPSVALDRSQCRCEIARWVRLNEIYQYFNRGFP